MTIAGDPLRVVWDALQRHGYGPHGAAYDFRARCPGHDGGNPSALHVCEGIDGRVVMHCFAHICEVERIVAPLGLTVADLFPPGHRHARRRHMHEARRSEFDGVARDAANTLLAVSRLGPAFRNETVTDCPCCGSPNASLTVSTDFGHVLVQCASGCTLRMFTDALAARVDEGAA